LRGVNITVNETGEGRWDNLTLGKIVAVPKANCRIGWRNVSIGR
jgi:hypothetical protein